MPPRCRAYMGRCRVRPTARLIHTASCGRIANTALARPTYLIPRSCQPGAIDDARRLAQTERTTQSHDLPALETQAKDPRNVVCLE